MLVGVAVVLATAAGCRSSQSMMPDNNPPGASADAALLDAPSSQGPELGCDPYVTRTPEAEVFIGPEGLENRVLDYIGASTSQLWVMMYVLTDDDVVAGLIAAHRRGVDVRVLLDGDQSENADARADLLAAGVAVRSAPAQYTFAHSKVLLIDSDTAIVLSGNLTVSSFRDQRNYGAVTRDAEDIADLAAIFTSDWAGEGFPDLSCTRLLVSPVNARQRVLEHINRAETSLDVAVLYLLDNAVRNATIESHRNGVAVRVLLAHPSYRPGNEKTAQELSQAGVEVRYLPSPDLHAKLLIADGVPLVGSHNMSSTSLTENREVGLMIPEPEGRVMVQAQFDRDWLSGVAP